MVKMIIASLALVSGVASAAVLDSADYTCQGLRHEISNNGWQIVNGEVLFPNANDCSDDSTLVWVATKDAKHCPAGYACRSNGLDSLTK